MRLAWAVVLVIAVFVGVGWGVGHAVSVHAAWGTPVAQVRLSSAMAGLFAGGAVALLVSIALVRRTNGRTR